MMPPGRGEPIGERRSGVPMRLRLNTNRPVRRWLITVIAGAALVATACDVPPPPGTGRGSLDLSLLNRPSLADADSRVGNVAPTAAQTSEVTGLGAAVRWSRYGTPSSLIRYGNFLASGLSGSPAVVARTFVQTHHALFRFFPPRMFRRSRWSTTRRSPAPTPMPCFCGSGSGRFGRARMGSSQSAWSATRSRTSLRARAGSGPAPAGATLSVRSGLADAAANVGRTVGAGDLGAITADHGWSQFTVRGSARHSAAGWSPSRSPGVARARRV